MGKVATAFKTAFSLLMVLARKSLILKEVIGTFSCFGRIGKPVATLRVSGTIARNRHFAFLVFQQELPEV